MINTTMANYTEEQAGLIITALSLYNQQYLSFQQTMADTKILDRLMQKVGTNGCYQTLVIALCFGIQFQQGAVSFFNAFLFYQKPYSCPESITNCHDYVCSLAPEDRKAYVDPNFTSLASDFGDYRCQSTSEMEVVQTVGFFGGIVALVVTIFLNKVMTMNNISLASLIFSLAGLMLMVTTPGVAVVTVGLFLVQGTRCVLNQTMYSYVSVVSASENRTRNIIILQTFFALSTVLLGLVYYFIRPWKLAFSLYHILPSAIFLVLMFWYAEDTAIEIVTFFQPSIAKQKFESIAKINGIQSEMSVSEVAEVKQQLHTSQRSSQQNQSLGPTDLFKYKSLRWPTIMSIAMHFFVSYQYNAAQLVLRDYSIDIYISGPVIGFSQLAAMVVCLFITQRVPRKQGVIVPEIISVVVATILLIWLSCGPGQCSQTMQYLQMGGLLLYCFMTNIAYNFFYLLQVEFYPQQIRATALMVTAIAMRLAVMIVPYVQVWLEQAKVSIILSFLISSVLVIPSTAGFPETFNQTPPEVIEELRMPGQAVAEQQENLEREY